MKSLSYGEALGIGGLAALLVVLGVVLGQPDPGGQEAELLTKRCDWEACATYFCGPGERCVQLTDYRY